MKTAFTDRFMAEVEANEKHPLEFMYDTQNVSAKIGFDFKTIDLAFAKVHEEVDEMSEAYEKRHEDWAHFEEELGDCFFTLINLCRHAKVSPEEIIKANVIKYLKRCQYIEGSLDADGKEWTDASPEDIQRLWNEYKMIEANKIQKNKEK